MSLLLFRNPAPEGRKNSYDTDSGGTTEFSRVPFTAGTLATLRRLPEVAMFAIR